MPGRIDDTEAETLDVDVVSVGDTHRDDIDTALFPHNRYAVRALP